MMKGFAYSFVLLTFLQSNVHLFVLAADLNSMTQLSSVDGELSVTLDVDKYFFDDSNTGTKFWTRVYNRDSISGDILQPGPVLRFKRGDNVSVTLNNNLGPETGSYSNLNSFHYYNTTNLHTHGLHISAESPQDNVLMTVSPKGSYTYEYDIPDDHAAGTFWYHAHHHGSTAAQVGGGLLGAIIIEDDATEVPDEIHNMNEVILLMSHVPIWDMMDKYTSESGDELFGSPDNVYNNGDEYVLVNGQYQPTGSLEKGKWNRLRIIYSGLLAALHLTMTSDTADCEWYLLAKDGIYVEGAPRSFGDTIFLGPGNRADVAMRCSSSGSVVLGASGGNNRLVSQTNIVTLSVSGDSDDDEDLPHFSPYRPDYLADLYTTTSATSQFNLNFGPGGGGCMINDVSWDGSTPLGSIVTGSIQEWTVQGTDKHPFHIHVNSYQLKGVTDSSNSGFFEEGDWHDVMFAPDGVFVSKFMFAVDSFVTKSVIHCHFLPHEDLGCMGYVQHTGTHGATTGLTGQSMSCMGTSTGSKSFYSNCSSISSEVDDDVGDDDFCFHIDTMIDYRGVVYSYDDLKAGKESECTVPHAPSSRGVVIITSCGEQALRVTDTHLIATSNGFVLAYSLKKGDVIYGDYDGEKLCIVQSVVKEKSVEKYFGLNCIHSEVLASGIRTSTFGDFHTLPSWYMAYVGGAFGTGAAGYVGEYIAEWFFRQYHHLSKRVFKMLCIF